MFGVQCLWLGSLVQVQGSELGHLRLEVAGEGAGGGGGRGGGADMMTPNLVMSDATVLPRE